MNDRENLLSLLKRQGFERVPVDFSLCPYLLQKYKEHTGSELDYQDYFRMPWRTVDDIVTDGDRNRFRKWHRPALKEDAYIDDWGVGHEKGSAAAMHMTRMRHPLQGIDSLEEIKEYPFPRYGEGGAGHQKKQAEGILGKGLAAVGSMQCTIWETAWYLRSMEDLMTDMMGEDPIAEYILDTVTDASVIRAESYARAGVDILFLGDDIGTQSTIMMSPELYRAWLKPRLKRVIGAAREIRPEIIVFYHSCGYITPFIEDLIDAGVDVLNPIQSECMSFRDIHAEYGDSLSFHGGVGTQTVMPFGTPDEVQSAVRGLLDIAGEKGGLFVAPTHVLEPEVPFANILAYTEACERYGRH